MLPMTTFDSRKHEGDYEPEDGSIQPLSKPKLDIKHTFMKWFIDCMTVGALLNTVAFLVLMGLMKGQPRAQIASNVRTVSYAPRPRTQVVQCAGYADDG